VNHPLCFLEKIPEPQVTDFAAPEPPHPFQRERLKGEEVESVGQLTGQFPLPIGPDIGNLCGEPVPRLILLLFWRLILSVSGLKPAELYATAATLPFSGCGAAIFSPFESVRKSRNPKSAPAV
jgi:hypothetical protein